MTKNLEILTRKKDILEIKRLLLVVDVVKGFMEKGSMADPKMRHIIPSVIELVQNFQGKEAVIGFIKDSHKSSAIEFNKFPIHCLENTEESELIDELKNYEENSLTYLKNSTSAMYAPEFLDNIKALINLKEIVIAGVCTDICDLNLALPLINYFDENNQNVEIIVPTNAVDTYDALSHPKDEYNEIALKLMRQAGIKVIPKYERGER